MAETNRDLIDILADLSGGGGADDARSKRRRTRGLPADDARLELARTYLKHQHRLWPELVKAGVLPKRTEPNTARLADQFRGAFEEGDWTTFQPGPGAPPWDTLGAAYLRYSDDGSNPRSLDQQLVNVLEKARQDRVFVAWEYVFADAAVTGTTAGRRGYQQAKGLIQRGPDEIGRVYIDELGRASRDAVEALNLGRLIELTGRRMVGASDGFDSASPTAKVQLHIYAMIHELFIDQLRAKVRRGMRDAFDRGRNLHKPAVGYKLVPVTDEAGAPVVDDGRPQTERVVDEEAAGAIREAFELYADRSWSRDKIAERFNQRTVGGVRTWDSARIRQLLARSTYRGVEFYEMTYLVRDPATGGVTVKRRPPAEWRRRDVPDLRIVPDDLWERAAARLATSQAAYDKARAANGPTRADLHPKALVRPVCGVCEQPLWLGRSGKYASYFCRNGKHGKGGCTFRGYKSAKIVEEAVVDAVAGAVLGDGFVAEVVAAANQFLASQPDRTGGEHAAKLEAEVRRRQKAVEVVTAQLEGADGTTDLGPVFERVSVMTRELTRLRAELAAAKAGTGEKPPPLTAEAVAPLLADLRGLLRDDVGAAAPVLAALTGPVVVTQEPVADGGDPEWVARFAVDAVPVLRSLAAKRGCPTAGAWEYLSTAGWTTGREVVARLRGTRQQERNAAEAAALAAAGASLETISHVLGTDWQGAKRAVECGLAGDAPPPGPLPARPGRPRKPHPQAAEIVRLRDEEQWSFLRIAAHLGITNGTATRAYDRHSGTYRAAAEGGQTPDRGSYRLLDRKRLARIETMLRAGYTNNEVAEAVGCGVSTVCRERKRLGLTGTRGNRRRTQTDPWEM